MIKILSIIGKDKLMATVNLYCAVGILQNYTIQQTKEKAVKYLINVIPSANEQKLRALILSSYNLMRREVK